MNIDTKKHPQSWLLIVDLQEIKEDISNFGYSKEFIAANQALTKKSSLWSNPQTKQVNYREPLEVKKIDGAVFYRAVPEQDVPRTPESFDTQYGVFLNHDHGEFSSWLSKSTLKDPDEPMEEEIESPLLFDEDDYVVQGNFCDMFDCGDFVFAISNLMHLGAGLFEIVRIDANYRAVTMFDNFSLSAFSQLEYLGRYENDFGYIVVVSGRVGLDDNDPSKYEHRTMLLQLHTDGSVEIDREWAVSVASANSLVVLGDDVYFGQNKMVTVLDTLTGDVKYLTNKSDEELAALGEMW